MEVYLLETFYSETERYEQILLQLPGTSYWFGTYLFNDYTTLESICFTEKFWESVSTQKNDKLTYLGRL